jgi:hypothetical protein
VLESKSCAEAIGCSAGGAVKLGTGVARSFRQSDGRAISSDENAPTQLQPLLWQVQSMSVAPGSQVLPTGLHAVPRERDRQHQDRAQRSAHDRLPTCAPAAVLP